MKLELGAEPKKIAILLALVAVGAYVVYDNIWNAPGPGGETARPAKKSPLLPDVDEPFAAAPKSGSAAAPAPRKAAQRGRAGEFRPTLKMDADPAKMDPTLRLDLLEKVAAVTMSRVERSLFEFATAPPKPEAAKPKLPEPKIEVAKRFIGPPEAPPPPPPAPKPKPPAINLKFYGSSLPAGQDGVKRVFVMEGDEIFTPAEGDVLKRRYKIVRITPVSVVVEDLDYKNQQTLPIEQIPKTS